MPNSTANKWLACVLPPSGVNETHLGMQLAGKAHGIAQRLRDFGFAATGG